MAGPIDNTRKIDLGAANQDGGLPLADVGRPPSYQLTVDVCRYTIRYPLFIAILRRPERL